MEATETTTKICAYPTCPYAGQPQPIKNFPLSKGTASRRYCKPCYSRWKRDDQRERRHTRKAAHGVEGSPELYGRACNQHCPEWKSCNSLKLCNTLQPLPCEMLLPDESSDYEASDLTLLSFPVDVTLRLDLITSV